MLMWVDPMPMWIDPMPMWVDPMPMWVDPELVRADRVVRERRGRGIDGAGGAPVLAGPRGPLVVVVIVVVVAVIVLVIVDGVDRAIVGEVLQLDESSVALLPPRARRQLVP